MSYKISGFSMGSCLEVQHQMAHFSINLPFKTNFNWERFTEQHPKISTFWKKGEGLVGLLTDTGESRECFIKTN